MTDTLTREEQDELILEHLHLPRVVVRGYIPQIMISGVGVDEAISVLTFELVRAARLFRPGRAPFHQWYRLLAGQALRRVLKSHTRIGIRIPRTVPNDERGQFWERHHNSGADILDTLPSREAEPVLEESESQL